MIDLHSHVLPAVDDGAATLSDSLAMLSESKKQGVTLLAATPHCVIHKEEDIGAFLSRRDEAMRQVLSQNADIPRLTAGAEIYLDNDIARYDGVEKLSIGDTGRMLLEMAKPHYDVHVEEWIYGLIRKGVTPVIAHICRYPDYLELADVFSAKELIFQVNATRLLSMHGRRWLKQILKRTDRVIISSDMHNMGQRACFMEKAHKKAERYFPEAAETLFPKAL